MNRNQANIQSAANFLVDLAKHYHWIKDSERAGLNFGEQPRFIYHQAFNFVLDLIGVTDHPEIDMRHGLRRIFEQNPPHSQAEGEKLLVLINKVANLDENEIKQALDSDRTAEIYFSPEQFFGEENLD